MNTETVHYAHKRDRLWFRPTSVRCPL